MSKVLSTIGAVVLFVLAGYGLVKLMSASVSYFQGPKAAEIAGPIVKGAASSVANTVKQTLKETPDSKLEEDSEILSRKLYFITKGALKGQMDAILKDTKGPDVRNKMLQAGKDVSQNVVAPLARGLAEGSSNTLKELQQTVGGIRQFLDENRDLVNTVTDGLRDLRRNLEQNAPPPPPFPKSQPITPLPLPGPGAVEPLPPHSR